MYNLRVYEIRRQRRRRFCHDSHFREIISPKCRKKKLQINFLFSFFSAPAFFARTSIVVCVRNSLLRHMLRSLWLLALCFTFFHFMFQLSKFSHGHRFEHASTFNTEMMKNSLSLLDMRQNGVVAAAVTMMMKYECVSLCRFFFCEASQRQKTEK